MKLTRSIVGMAVFFVAAGVCAAAWAKPLRIVTTTSDLASLAQAVAGDKAVVTSICDGTQDPHMISAKPGFILAARDADLFIRIGLELEIGWEPPIIDGSRNTRIRQGNIGHLDASQAALILDIPATTVTRAMGDIHPFGNPHYWLDPLNGRRVAQAICSRLCQLAPAERAYFEENLSSFQKALDERMFGTELLGKYAPEQLWAMTEDGSIAELLKKNPQDKGWTGALAQLRGKKIVTYHRSWVYFAHRFGIGIAAELEPKPGIPPTAAHLAYVVDVVRNEAVPLLLQEPFYSVKTAQTVADKTGARVVVAASSVGGRPQAADYLSLFDHIVAQVRDGA